MKVVVDINDKFLFFKISFLVKTCNTFLAPEFGSVKCEHPDLGIVYDETEKNLPVDAVCNFECEKGYLLIGSTERTCLPIARWDGLRTLCKRKY